MKDPEPHVFLADYDYETMTIKAMVWVDPEDEDVISEPLTALWIYRGSCVRVAHHLNEAAYRKFVSTKGLSFEPVPDGPEEGGFEIIKPTFAALPPADTHGSRAVSAAPSREGSTRGGADDRLLRLRRSGDPHTSSTSAIMEQPDFEDK